MNPKAFKYLFLIVVFTLLQSYTVNLSISDTKISSSRNQNQANICGYSSTTFTSQQRQKSKKAVTQYDFLSQQEKIKRLTSGDYNSPYSGVILVTIPHVIALTVLLILIPCLFCCCTWPQKYPQWKKIRKPDNYQYKKQQLKIPAYGSVIFFTLIIVGTLMALVDAHKIVGHYNNVGCKNATMLDDLLNGRMSNDQQGKFFVGLLPLKAELKTFATSKISTFFSQGSNSLSTANDVRTKQGAYDISIKQVYTNYNNENYIDVFTPDAGTTYTSVSSQFKDIYLGPVNDQAKILGNIYHKLNFIFDEINLALDDMISAWGILSTKTQAGVTGEINNVDLSIGTFKVEIEKYLKKIGEKYHNPELNDALEISLKAFYGMAFAGALIGFVSSVWISCCKVANCRFFMYFGCGTLNFISIIGFLYLSYLAFYHPQITEMCHFADQKLSTGNGTKQLFTWMGLSQFADKIQPCMSDGDGKILTKIDSSFSQSFDKINVIAQGTLKFNSKIPLYTPTNIDTPFNEGFTLITKVGAVQLWEINNTMAKTHVQNIVSKFYPIGINCHNLNVQGDSWMPSFDLISCPAGRAKMNPCSNLADKTICPLGCYQILNTITSPSGDASYISTLSSRYTLNTCNYYDFIHRLYTKWIVPNKNKMNALKISVNNVKTSVADYTVKVDSVKASLNTFQTSLETNFDSMTNLKSGSFNGMDCKIISQTIWEFRDSVCIGLRQSIMYNIICLCLICYGTLLMSCFVTMAGVRHYQSAKKTIVRDNLNEYQNSSIIKQSNQLVQSQQR